MVRRLSGSLPDGTTIPTSATCWSGIVFDEEPSGRARPGDVPDEEGKQWHYRARFALGVRQMDHERLRVRRALHVQTISRRHSQIKSFLHHFRGIATKCSDSYLGGSISSNSATLHRQEPSCGGNGQTMPMIHELSQSDRLVFRNSFIDRMLIAVYEENLRGKPCQIAMKDDCFWPG